jgi:hypothetical protein
MTADTVFSIAGTSVLPMWLLMIVLPKWNVTRFLVDYRVLPLLLSLVYATYIGISLQGGANFDFGTLDSVMNLFTEKDAVLAGWIHYLAFDLLVGMWMVQKNRTLGIHPVLMAPCLFGTFMFGPVGFLLFSLIRSFKKEK